MKNITCVLKKCTVPLLYLLFTATLFAQTGTVSGTVKNIDGTPLLGANVRVNLTNLGIASDDEGNFTLTNVAVGEQTIIVTLVGYQRFEEKITIGENSESTLEITLLENILALSEVAVTASRREVLIAKTPRALEVVPTETLDYYTEQTSDLSATLGKFIPNFTSPSVGNDVFLATLRGRAPLYLLDGIPLQSNEGLRGAVLGNIDPSALERVEVLYGASTIYGGGAPGGVIQFFTKEASSKRIAADVQLFSRTYMVGDAFLGSESTDFRTAATISGTLGKFTYLVNGALETTNGQFRPDGERIAPNGTSAYDDFSLLAKVGYNFTPKQSLKVMLNRTRREPNDLAFAPGFSEEEVLANPEGAAGIAIPVDNPFSYDNEVRQEYLALSATYENTDLFGGSFKFLGYYFDLTFQQEGADIRPFQQSNGGTLPDFWPGLFQTSTAASQTGIRTEWVKQLSPEAVLTVGGGMLWSDDSTPVTLSSDGPFDSQNRFDGAGGIQDQGAPSELFNGGIFAQADIDVTEELRLSGGARFDVISFDVLPFAPTFTTVAPGENRLGGSGSNSGLSINFGAAYEFVENTTLYANLSQGFSIPSLAFLVVNVAPNEVIEGDEIVSPQIVNSLDFGLRGQLGDDFAYGLAGFYAFSKDASQIQFDDETGQGSRLQAPQRNYGFEVTMSAAPTADLRLDASISVTETDVDPQDDGTFQPASTIETVPFTTSLRASYNIPAVKGLSMNAELYSLANRDRAFNFLVDADNDGQIDLDDEGNPTRADGFRLRGYTTLDLGTNFVFPKKWLGEVDGTFSVRVQNLFNETYVPLISQRQFGDLFAARRRNGFGTNMTFTLTFRI
ncbi:MAG: TonB-dependent receptor [Bacteroidota bacterium]